MSDYLQWAQAKALVNRGAKILDQYYGEYSWVDKISLDMLDIKDLYRCVLGQLFGSYGNGLCVLDVWGPTHGFCPGDVDSDHLNEAWRDLIRSSRD